MEMKTAHVFFLTFILAISAMTFSCGSNESVLSSEESETTLHDDETPVRYDNDGTESGGK
jgi:hypothetical protein